MKTTLLFFLILTIYVGNVFSQTELIIDGNFSTMNSAWITSGNFDYGQTYTNSPCGSPSTGYAYIANSTGSPDNNLSGTIKQIVTIPVNCSSATLSFCWNATGTENATGHDGITAFISLVNSPYTWYLAAQPWAIGNVSGSTLTYTLTDPNLLLAGTQLSIEFDGATNSSLPSTLRLDNVSFIYVASTPCTPVSMVTQPQTQTQTVGNTATFNVSVNGTPPFSYFWYGPSGFITNTTNTSSTSNSYTTPILNTSDAGNYYCLINNCNNNNQAQSNYAYLTVNPVTQYGSVHVTINPSSAVSAGALWNIDGGSWQNSGTTLNNILTGNHTINFYSITGWTSPNSQSITVTNGNTNNLTGTYIQNVTYGSVKVIINPSGAVSAGATWNLDGTGNYASGYILPNVLTGNHTVGFNIVSGWIAPNSQSISVTNGNTNNLTGTYTQNTTILPDLTITYPSVNISNLIPLASTQITYTINNIGNGTAGNSITSFFLSNDNVYNSGIDTWIKDDYIPSLPITGSTTRTVTVSIPSNIPSNLWYIIIIANAPHDLNETDYTNNYSFISVNVEESILCDTNTFPFGEGAPPCLVGGDIWGFIKYQCVSYVAWKVNEFFGETSITLPTNEYPFNNWIFDGDHSDISTICNVIGVDYRLSNACRWNNIFSANGVTVNNIPSIGSIAWWEGHSDPSINGAGENGHVAYVNSVTGSVICVSEYNWGTDYKCKFNHRTLDMSQPNIQGNRTPDKFIHVEVSGLGGIGVPELAMEDKILNIYPNPSSGVFTIALNSNMKKDVQINIYNMLGEIVYKEQLHNFNKIELNLSDFNQGVYILILKGEDEILNKKIVIEK
ncbi:MAG: T9SS type A sorting domain-containing protein [Candidatus Paceibacterota bacterium]|jgi:hypothetical protein